MTLKLFVLSDFESLGFADSSFFKTPSLSDFETLRTFRLRIFGGYILSVLLRLRVFRTLKLFLLSDFDSLGVADSSYFKTPSLSYLRLVKTL